MSSEKVMAEMDDLARRLRIKAGMIEMGELIAWGSDSALMREAADALEVAAPAVQGELVVHTFYALHDATEGQKYIKKDIDDGCLAIFEREEDAQRAKRRHPGTEYMRVDYYAAPQPAEQQPDVAQLVEALERAHMALIGYLPGHRNDITDAAISHCEQALAAYRKQWGEE